MKDQLTNHSAQPNADWLNAMGELNAEQEQALDRAEMDLNEARFMKVMRMTATRFAQLSPAEKRNYVRWAKHLARVFNEKAAMLSRNSPPDLDVPTFLQRPSP